MGNMSGCSQLRRVILCVCAAKLESVNSLQSEKSALPVTDQITMMGRWACLLARGLVSLGNKAPRQSGCEIPGDAADHGDA